MSKIKLPFTVLRMAFSLFKFENQQIFYPFIIIIFINSLVLEILYFLPRYPLSVFFAPIIRNLWGEEYLHFPMDLVLLPKLFFYAQMGIFLFLSSFLTVLIVDMVVDVNNEKKVNFKASLQRSLGGYVYIFLYSFLSIFLFQVFNKFYSILVRKISCTL